MPTFTDEDHRVLIYVRQWYRDHRGALPASTVAQALDLPCAAVSSTAAVLAAAGAVRTHHSPCAHEQHRDALFLDAPPAAQRMIDLTTSDTVSITH